MRVTPWRSTVVRIGATAMAVVAATACSASELELDRGNATTAPTTAAPGAPSTTVSEPRSTGVAGADGVGDPYYPELGNGGYDVAAYDLEVEWLPESTSIDGTATITLTPTEALDTFNLDLEGLAVEQVTVDGTAAEFRHDGHELRIDPAPVLDAGTATRVVVDYGGTPTPIRVGTDVFRVGWHADGRDAFVVSEPAGAASWFPANDHPVDKARFRFTVTVPSDLTVIANGLRQAVTETGDGRTVFEYEAGDPMATYLASVVVGDLVFVEDTTASGLPLRSAYPRRLADAAAIDFADTADMIATFEEHFGPYPFETYGHVVADEALGFALENQTVSIFGSDLVTGRGAIDAVVAHELAHQWFGNAVSPATWMDVWLNEGIANYAEWLWGESSGGPSIEQAAEATHARADFGVPPGDPGPDELFQATVYLRGGLALYALSQEIGPDAFGRLLPMWVERHGGGVASTADLQALAEELSGRDLEAFFDAWVYGASLPPLP
jgi:aminopeptidase N